MMGVYVDEAMIPYRGMKMIHMVADSRGELREVVSALDLDWNWVQNEGEPSEHFDVCKSKRRRAIDELGVQPVSGGELIEVIRRKRNQPL